MKVYFFGFIALIIVTINLGMTFTNKNQWPFCPYNMFNFNSKTIVYKYKIQLYTSDGEVSFCNPEEVVPLEFFRAGIFFKKIFGNDSLKSEEEKRDISNKIINNINSSEWNEFDEISNSIQLNNSEVCGFNFLIIEHDLEKYNYVNQLNFSILDTLYTYNKCNN